MFFYICAIISGVSKATDFYFGPYIRRVHPNKRLLKIFRKSKQGGEGHSAAGWGIGDLL